MDKHALVEKIESFQALTVLVIGDVILDAYFSGKVNRISPEAPVPILDIESKEYRLGGAANVALNLQALGATPILCSIIGSDYAGGQVLELMKSDALSIAGLQSSPERRTTIKTRMVSSNNQMLRMDEEQTDVLSEEDDTRLMRTILGLIDSEKPDAIIFEDYDKGTINGVMISKVIQKARELDIPVAVDPKKRNFLSYAGATLYKPNLKELRDGLNLLDIAAEKEALENAFNLLNDIMPIQNVLFTLSADGIFIGSESESHLLQTDAQDISDVSGAGDSVISVATCALVTGMSLHDVAFVSNLAGGWVCQFPGVVPITSEALTAKLLNTID